MNRPLMLAAALILALPTAAAAAPPADRGNGGAPYSYEAPLAGTVTDDGLIAFLNFADAAAACAGEPATTVTLTEKQTGQGAFVTRGGGAVPAVILPADADPCDNPEVLATGTVDLSYTDNDSGGSGTRGNAYGIRFRGTTDDGRSLSGKAHFTVTPDGDLASTDETIRLR